MRAGPLGRIAAFEPWQRNIRQVDAKRDFRLFGQEGEDEDSVGARRLRGFRTKVFVFLSLLALLSPMSIVVRGQQTHVHDLLHVREIPGENDGRVREVRVSHLLERLPASIIASISLSLMPRFFPSRISAILASSSF